MSKTLLPVVAAATAIAAPGLAEARQVTIETQLKNYNDDGAYLAVYITDSAGKYKGTLWMAGRKSRFWSHLTDWAKQAGRNPNVDGITGASVGSGKTLKISVDIADALIDAGYQVRVDSSVEDARDYGSDAVAPLTTANSGKPAAGKGYVQSLKVTF